MLGKDAARASTRAAGVQTQAYKKAGKKATGYLQPYEATGRQGYDLLADALGINGPEAQAAYFQNFQTDPGYIAARDAGIAGIEQSGASGGMLRSGGVLKALQDFGQRQMFSQFQDRLNRLGGFGESGLQTAGKMADIQYGSTLGAGNATASGIVGAANARTQGAQNLFNAGAGLLGAGIRGYFSPRPA